MTTHKWTYRNTKLFGVPCTITGTLCGRSDSSSDDGANSGDSDQVTCKLCLKIMKSRAARMLRELTDAGCKE